MNDAGRIGFLIKGDYKASTEYDFLDIVYYNGASYVAKTKTKGNTPEHDNEFWHIFADSGEGVAYAENAGKVNDHTVASDVPSDAVFTDGNVKQTNTDTTNAEYRVLFSNTADNTTRTEGTRKDKDLTYNPSTGKLSATKLTGNTADSTATFTSSDVDTASATSWTNTAALTSGEKHSSILAKISKMFKNIRYLYNNKIDLSKILTTVEACTASTDANSIPNAAVISELNSSLMRLSRWEKIVAYKENLNCNFDSGWHYITLPDIYVVGTICYALPVKNTESLTVFTSDDAGRIALYAMVNADDTAFTGNCWIYIVGFLHIR